MSRPSRCRCVRFRPRVTFFKPKGVPLRVLEEVVLSLDELESLRLVDFENLGQLEAAEKMEISQSTLQRILAKARQKVSLGLVEGRAIKVEGGPVRFCRCLRDGGRGLGRNRCTC